MLDNDGYNRHIYNMDKAGLIKSLRDWREFYLQQRDSLYDRQVKISLPTPDVALALIGIRRSGKTSLAIQVSQQISVDRVLYYNFEDPLFSSNSSTKDLDILLETAEEFSGDKLELLILDEIHNVLMWEKWLRKLIDLKRYRIIITGSSAKLIKSEIASALTGRTITKEIWSLSLVEFRDFNFQLKRELTVPKLCREYITYGGFPAVVLCENTLQKVELLRSYFSDILLKDVVIRNKIRNVKSLQNLATYIITNLSSLHSSVAIEKALGIDKETAIAYLGHLSDAFLINSCSLFSNNLKVQHRAANKYYLSDLGLRLVGARSVNSDDGKLLENLVYLELRRRSSEIYYFKGIGEVDFLTCDTYQPKAAYQVAFSIADNKTRERELGALLDVANKYNLRELYIVTWNEEENINAEGRKIKVLPVSKFCGI
jgi:uncharacterized protein